MMILCYKWGKITQREAYKAYWRPYMAYYKADGPPKLFVHHFSAFYRHTRPSMLNNICAT